MSILNYIWMPINWINSIIKFKEKDIIHWDRIIKELDERMLLSLLEDQDLALQFPWKNLKPLDYLDNEPKSVKDKFLSFYFRWKWENFCKKSGIFYRKITSARCARHGNKL